MQTRNPQSAVSPVSQRLTAASSEYWAEDVWMPYWRGFHGGEQFFLVTL